MEEKCPPVRPGSKVLAQFLKMPEPQARPPTREYQTPQEHPEDRARSQPCRGAQIEQGSALKRR